MSTAQISLDAGVAIDRVRVVVGPARTDDEGLFAPVAPSSAMRLRPGDHRIVVGELRIETEAALDASDARQLGDRIARAVGEGLAALQGRRLGAILAGTSRGGAIRIGTLRAKLCGAYAEQDCTGTVARALIDAVERRVTS